MFRREEFIRPFVFITPVGVGQVNAGVDVTVCDTVDDDGGPLGGDAENGNCPSTDEDGNPVQIREQIGAYQVTGLNFTAIGAGALFALHDLVGVAAELKVMVLWPTTGVALAMAVAPTFQF